MLPVFPTNRIFVLLLVKMSLYLSIDSNNIRVWENCGLCKGQTDIMSIIPYESVGITIAIVADMAAMGAWGGRRPIREVNAAN